MSCNVGGTERAMRIALGGALLTGGLLGPEQAPGRRTAAVLAGAISLATAVTQYCPLNAALGVNTCPPAERNEGAPDLVRRSTPTADRVTANTASEVNQRLRREAEERVAQCATAGPTAITERLKELDREWDLERVMEAESASMLLLGLSLGATVNRRLYGLPAVVASMVLTHALHGWYPLLPLFRRLGIRTSEEIATERNALKTLRGDFEQVSRAHEPAVGQILAAVRARGGPEASLRLTKDRPQRRLFP